MARGVAKDGLLVKSRKIFWGLGLFLALAVFLVEWIYPKTAVPVLMYHQVTEGEAANKLEVSKKTFAMQMVYLKNQGFRVIAPDELVRMVQSGQRPDNEVVLTFDDGYQDNCAQAAAILESFGLRGTFFIVTDWIGKSGWMTWEQVLDLQRRGHTIGAHSVTHRFLTAMSLAEAKDEIYNSKKLLEEKLGRPVQFFCYPAGRFSTAVENLVRQAGYKGAFTNAPGWAFSNRDVFALKRIRISDNYNDPLRFGWRLTGYFLFFRERGARRMTGWG